MSPLCNYACKVIKNSILLLSILLPTISQANNLTADIFSFEEQQVPSWVIAEQVEVSSKRAILGEQSLYWQWDKTTSLNLNQLSIQRLTDAQATSAYVSNATQVLSFWLYNEQAIDAALTVELTDDTNGISTTFPVNLNFTGWRAIGVSLNLDLNESFKNTSELSSIKFTSPTKTGMTTGALYLDRVMVSVDDYRYQWSDDQVTTRIIEPEIDFQLAADLPTPSFTEIDNAELIKQTLITEFSGDPGSLAELENSFANFLISKDINGVIRGRHLLTDKQQVIYQPDYLTATDKLAFDEYAILGESDGKGNKVAGYSKLMLDIAKAYHHSKYVNDQPRLAEMYQLMTEHLLDQGFAGGSSLVTTHHWGYSGRWWYISALMMEQTLADNQLIDPVYQALLWYSREFKDSFDMQLNATSSNLDYFNTLSIQHLALLLLNPDDKERIALLHKFAPFFSGALAQTPPGTNDGFRPDGTAFRHHGNYPGYSFPAFKNAGHVVYMLKNTLFSINNAGMDKLKLVMVAGWNYTNSVVPIGISGRHPFTTLGVKGYASALKWVANSYPQVDQELAAIYLQVMNISEQESSQHFGQNIKPASLPEGSWSYNGGAFGVHRSGDRMAMLKGYNKDVWSAEIYTKDNRFGRYQSHGSVHVLPYGDPVAYGFQQEGWDWNRNPGSTAIHLPLSLLESPKTSTLMVRSEEGVSGSVSLQQKYGLFTFKHQAPSNITNFEPSFTAHKQVLTIDNKLYLSGNRISNTDSANNTETTLFQLAIGNNSQGLFINNSQRITSNTFSTVIGSGDWIIDDNGVGYYLINAPQVKVQRAMQNSKHNKTKADTSGLFSSAWINHGAAPDQASYEYIVVMQATPSVMTALAQEMNNSPLFKVLMTNPDQQLIWSKTDNLYGYTSYIASSFNQGPVKDIDTTALVLAKVEAEQLHLSITAPELNIRDNDQPIQTVPVTVEINGLWQTDSLAYSQTADTTVITAESLFGQSVNVSLWPEGQDKPDPTPDPDPDPGPDPDPDPDPGPDPEPESGSGGSFNFSLLAFLGLLLAFRIKQ